MTWLPPGVDNDDRVVLVEGERVMCIAGAQALIRAYRKTRFKFGTTQSPEGKRLLAWHGLLLSPENAAHLWKPSTMGHRAA